MNDEIVVRSPYDDSEIGRVPSMDARQVEAAVKTARAALDAARLPQHERAAILDRAAALIGDRVEELARTIAAEAAKPLKTAIVEASRCASTFSFAAVEARRLAGDVVPMEASTAGAGKIGFTLRVPIGVVGGITPFNFPLNLVAHKVAPALAAGCPIVVKPASQTPLSALALRDLLVDGCGLPPAWFQIVTGPASVVGAALVDHPDVPYISFTGSGPVGWGLRAQAPKKRVNLELGNNSPVIIEPDSDWQTAAAKIAVGGFSHAGQSCISTQRVYVHRSIQLAFLDELVPRVSALKVGDPMQADTDVSALISIDDRDRVYSWIEEAATQGARVLCGGRIQGRLLTPAVLADAASDMRVCREEVFGPVVAVAAYDSLDEALALANDSRYGLQAAVFTSRIDVALAAARRLDYGGVLVNEVPTFRADQMPYGGSRDSGNTREGPAYAIREMTEERLVVIQP